MPHKKPTPLSDEDAAALARLREAERNATGTELTGRALARWRAKTKDPIGADADGKIRTSG